jgi:hypothetical protein
VPVDDYPEAWANEILPLAREAHTRLHDRNVTPKLDQDKMVADGEIVEQLDTGHLTYSRWAAAVVLEELHKAGWRLADLLQRA